MLANPGGTSSDFRGRIPATLGRVDDPQAASIVLAAYPKMELELQPKAIELLTYAAPPGASPSSRPSRPRPFPSVLNVNQIRRLSQTKDQELAQLVKTHWGTCVSNATRRANR